MALFDLSITGSMNQVIQQFYTNCQSSLCNDLQIELGEQECLNYVPQTREWSKIFSAHVQDSVLS